MSDLLTTRFLELHFGKTECILLEPMRKIISIYHFQINRNGHLIKLQSSIKYLGIDLDHSLSGERTVNTIIEIVNCRSRFIEKPIVYLWGRGMLSL